METKNEEIKKENFNPEKRENSSSEKTRDLILSRLDKKTDNVDLQYIIDLSSLYSSSGELKEAEKINRYYQTNGNFFLQSIFNGKLEDCKKFASENDLKILERITLK